MFVLEVQGWSKPFAKCMNAVQGSEITAEVRQSVKPTKTKGLTLYNRSTALNSGHRASS
jgi:hypothetical protein